MIVLSVVVKELVSTEHSSRCAILKDAHFYASSSADLKNADDVNREPLESTRDGVQLFCEKHFAKIKTFISNISTDVPLPAKCSVVNGKHKRYMQLHFDCSRPGEQCLYTGSHFTLPTRLPKLWVHLMFLAVQAKAKCALSQKDIDVSCLKACWDALRSETPSSFLALVTSSFPSQKDQLTLLQELHQSRYFDVFELSPSCSRWACFVCTHPEKLNQLLTDGSPEIAGQLKEKKGKWMFFKRWKTRYLTLSGGSITYNKSNATKTSLPVTKIQSVKAVRKGIRDIPRAFEIFTGDQTYMFKAKSHQNVEQWVQCLHIAVARSHSAGGAVVTNAERQRASNTEEEHGAMVRPEVPQKKSIDGKDMEEGWSGQFPTEERDPCYVGSRVEGRSRTGMSISQSTAGSGGEARLSGVEKRKSGSNGARRTVGVSGAGADGKTWDFQDDSNSVGSHSNDTSGSNTTFAGKVSNEEFFRRSSIRRSSGAGSVGGRSVGSSSKSRIGQHSNHNGDWSSKTYSGIQQDHSAAAIDSSIKVKTVNDTKL
ncbi:ventricular zone-expressed PH domain-containing protein [Elysia marginata]|uniref:Ventricular zone-expressed PH domain-containing protein n=1 Tax=Elysia marginata TaxID=1093978 RepID=A0AAV4EUH1_9GAST|nr:ventricular zone-expressed PH domain-containing protein [Elysia marginata]